MWIHLDFQRIKMIIYQQDFNGSNNVHGRGNSRSEIE